MKKHTYARGVVIELLIVKARLSSKVKPSIQKVQGQSCRKVQSVADVLPRYRSYSIHCLQVLLNLLTDTKSIRRRAFAFLDFVADFLDWRICPFFNP